MSESLPEEVSASIVCQDQFDVVLVCPPFFSVVRPSVGLGSLCATLKRAGISTKIFYANLEYAFKVGLYFNEWICLEPPNQWLIGDYIFAAALSDPPHFGSEQYFSTICDGLSNEHKIKIDAERRSSSLFVSAIADEILLFNPKIVGLSSTFQQTCSSLAIAKEIKKKRPEIVTCLGGANCEGEMGRELLRSFSFIDYVFSGESESSFLRFATDVVNETRLHQLSKPNAITECFIEGERVDLCSLEVPDHYDYFSTLKEKDQNSLVTPSIAFESSRGCWWGAKKHCTFCGLNGATLTYRSKSPTQVLSELDILYSRHGVSRFQAVDNIMDLKHVRTVFSELNRLAKPYRFFYEVKSNLSEEQITTIAIGGVSHLQPGIESLDDKVLAIMRKGTTTLQNVCFLRNCLELGVTPSWNFLFGFPGEELDSYSDMANLIPLVLHLPPPHSTCGRIRIDRFSPYHNAPAEFGIGGLRHAPAYDYLYQLNSTSLDRIAYFFATDIPIGMKDSEIAGMQVAVDQWVQFHKQAAVPPVLRVSEVDNHFFVHDTRPIAKAEWINLTSREGELMRQFRNPRDIDTLLLQMSEQEDFGFRPTFEKLVELKLLLVRGNRAVSLVEEAGRRIYSGNMNVIQPSGGVFGYSQNKF